MRSNSRDGLKAIVILATFMWGFFVLTPMWLTILYVLLQCADVPMWT